MPPHSHEQPEPVSPAPPSAQGDIAAAKPFRWGGQLLQYALGALGVLGLGFVAGYVHYVLSSAVYRAYPGWDALGPVFLFETTFWGLFLLALAWLSRLTGVKSLMLYGVIAVVLRVPFYFLPTDMFSYLLSYAPLTLDHQATLTKVLSLSSGFLPVYAVERAYTSWRRYQRSGSRYDWKFRALCLTALGLIVGSMIGSVFFSSSLYHNRQRQLMSIHLPNTAQLVTSEHRIYYTGQSKKQTPLSDTLGVKNLQHLSTRSVRQLCQSAQSSTGPTQPYTYKQLDDGFEYAEAVLPLSTEVTIAPFTQVALDQRFDYCFVIGNFLYTLQRDSGPDARVREHITAMSGAQMIQAIRDAPVYIYECHDPQANAESFPRITYCDAADYEAYKQLRDRAEEALKGITIPAAEANAKPAFVPVKSLHIKEWGITLPLSAEIQDAYYYFYSRNENGAVKEDVYIGLAALETTAATRAVCGAVRPSGPSALPKRGIAHITRTLLSKISSLPAGQSLLKAGSQIGGFNYIAASDAEAYSCIKLQPGLEAIEKASKFSVAISEAFRQASLQIR